MVVILNFALIYFGRVPSSAIELREQYQLYFINLLINYLIIYQMMMNRLTHTAFKGVFQQPLFFFSAKKKQMELTLRTPYRILPKI